MMLESFGAIMTFAAELEGMSKDFYETAAGNPQCGDVKAIFEQFARESGKNQKNALRIRRENVTEMILEPIKNFSSEPFLFEINNPGYDELNSVLPNAVELEETAANFYNEASARIKALPEVARTLKSLGKKRTARLNKLNEL